MWVIIYVSGGALARGIFLPQRREVVFKGIQGCTMDFLGTQSRVAPRVDTPLRS